ncbi:MAG: NTP transferase domain-containing protein [Candidatus Firestonebacteria bacterium]|nr:NTP transferase domain-containing protein [Candidatus Firestonebacteria bacterium]
MKAMILAAGGGTRLRPLTCKMPKPMVPVINKPVIEHVINLLKTYDIKDIMVNLHHYPESIQEHFGDGSNFGVKLNYSFEEVLMGTAGGVKKVENFFNDTFIVLSGDGISDINIKEAVLFHKSKKSIATLVLKEVDYPLEYGVVILNNEGAITRFLEKPNWGEVFSNTANTGAYIFEPEIFKLIPYGVEYDFGKDLFPKLLTENKPIYGFITSDYWCDIGDLPEYRQTHYDIFQKKIKIDFPGCEAAKNVWVGEGTKIHPKAIITGPVIIGKNCTIEEDVQISEYTTIGDNTVICKGTSIKRCVIWDRNYISEYNELRGCIIGQNCFLEASVTIFEGAVVGDGSTIGEKAIIKPNVKVWPDKIIETGVTLSTSLIWGEKWRKNLFGSYGISGKINVEITPEFAAKVGTAFGTCLKKGASVILSSYDNRMCKMLKRVIEGGLISAGINVYDAETLPSFINQFIIRTQGVSGGIFINKAVYDPDSISIDFFDSQGLNIDRNLEKKIEKVFFREEFVRVLATEFGKTINIKSPDDKYQEALNNFVDKEKIKNAGIKIVINNIENKFIINSILENIGCNIILTDNINEISNSVVKSKANLGIAFNSNMENFKIFNEKGETLLNDHALLFLLLLQLKNSSVGNIAVPVNISCVAEEIISKYNRKLFRTKTQASSLMKSCVENEIIFSGMGDGRYIFTKFQPVFDPVVSIVKLIEFLASEKNSISEICKEIPDYYLEKDTISCPWEYKGKILQDIVKEYKDKYDLELIDGIKIIFNPREWILLLPDSEKPFIHIWVESISLSKVQEITEKYKDKILQMIKN